jgi:DNA-binding response OmpR family regulator
MKVLMVDDNQDITDLVSKFLNAKGFENVVTNDPLEGLELIKNEKYDAILLDIAMPEFCGRDIICALEKENILKDQKIIIFSANAFTEREIDDLVKKEGVMCCLKKPIALNKLLTVITS